MEFNGLSDLSNTLADAVATAAKSVVRIDDGTRLTASGVIWTKEGIVVATSHGVERDEELTIETHDGKSYPATLVGRDDETDLAILRVQTDSLEPIVRADNNIVPVGEIALAIARPGLYGLQATLGIISGINESQRSGKPEFILQTDADVYPGFSGGALVNLRGQILGVLNLMYGRGRGIALGVPILENTIELLAKHGRIRRGYLGIRAQRVQLQETIRQGLGLEQQIGLLITQVEPNSPAELGGIVIGDILLTIGGETTETLETLRSILRSNQPDTSANVSILRGGTAVEVPLTFGADEA